jgi:hypothetical protein
VKFCLRQRLGYIKSDYAIMEKMAEMIMGLNPLHLWSISCFEVRLEVV